VRNAMESLEALPPDARELTIRTRAVEAGAVRLCVEDNGPGFDADDSERLFETFFTTKADGLGMGLAIGRTIVEDHGGLLWASRRAGGGAIFHVELPGAAEEAG
jgi:C4-dicarboxylate-specific signal transduction histidine kinase